MCYIMNNKHKLATPLEEPATSSYRNNNYKCRWKKIWSFYGQASNGGGVKQVDVTTTFLIS